MYVPAERLFCFRLRRPERRDVLEGLSPRYTAIVLIGLRDEVSAVGREVFGSHEAADVCAALARRLHDSDRLGDVALGLWASRLWDVKSAGDLRRQLESMDPTRGPHPTVELAWALTAASVRPALAGSDEGLARRLADQLMSRRSPASGLFAHAPATARGSRLRGHVCCFADWVYPVQALAHFYALTGDERAREAACKAARVMCSLQGDAGQWWWHFDVRTARVVERYPVYAVHQDGMAPMALFDLEETCAVSHRAAIDRGMAWLYRPAESGTSLIDEPAGVIWRKVARKEPGKLSRSLQAAASRLHSGFRVPLLDTLFPPGEIDFECRPYHLGWLLHAWPERRLKT